jgi:hypothetical protein
MILIFLEKKSLGKEEIQVYDSNHFELIQIRDGIYAAIAKDGGGAVGNAGFVDLGDKVIVFDTFNTQQAALDLKKYSGKDNEEVHYVCSE